MSKGKINTQREIIENLPSFWEVDNEFKNGVEYINKINENEIVKIKVKTTYPNEDYTGPNNKIVIEVKYKGERYLLGYEDSSWDSFESANKKVVKIMKEINECEKSLSKKIIKKIIGYDNF